MGFGEGEGEGVKGRVGGRGTFHPMFDVESQPRTLLLCKEGVKVIKCLMPPPPVIIEERKHYLLNACSIMNRKLLFTGNSTHTKATDHVLLALVHGRQVSRHFLDLRR